MIRPEKSQNCRRETESLTTEQEMQEISALTNWELFHRLWSKAVDSPRYQKQEWRELESRLASLGFLDDKTK
jgi:hypothetical protein